MALAQIRIGGHRLGAIILGNLAFPEELRQLAKQRRLIVRRARWKDEQKLNLKKT